jgi:hypothetical protein
MQPVKNRVSAGDAPDTLRNSSAAQKTIDNFLDSFPEIPLATEELPL